MSNFKSYIFVRRPGSIVGKENCFLGCNKSGTQSITGNLTRPFSGYYKKEKCPPELQLELFCLQTNTTFIANVAVRETILNLTLNNLAPELDSFAVEDYKLWFQVYLLPVVASLRPDSLRVIPTNISCESYGAM